MRRTLEEEIASLDRIKIYDRARELGADVDRAVALARQTSRRLERKPLLGPRDSVETQLLAALIVVEERSRLRVPLSRSSLPRWRAEAFSRSGKRLGASNPGRRGELVRVRARSSPAPGRQGEDVSEITVAALYVDERGPYMKMEGVDPWPESRDARNYAGPWPVVAHPPCGPWGSLSHLSHQVNSPKGGPHGYDKALAPIALEQVRRWGGVLEHPAGSKLWVHCGLPMPGQLPDAFGGITIAVEQVDFGHVARKKTWLYLVGVRDIGPRPPKREPTHWVSGGRSHARKGAGGFVPPGIKVCSAQQRRRTPPLFAEYLVRLARASVKGK